MRKLVATTVMTGLVAFAAPAVNADPVMAMSPTLMVGTTGVVAADDANQRRLGRRGAGVQSPIAATFAHRPMNRASVPIRLTYVPTASMQKHAANAFVERVRAKDPASAQQVADQIAKHDFGHIYADLVKSYGLRSDDAADAVAAYTVLGWVIVHNADLSPTVVRAIRDRIAPAIAANPALSRQRAALGEEIEILVVTLHAGWQKAMKEGKGAAYSNSVVRFFRQQAGVDLRNIRIG